MSTIAIAATTATIVRHGTPAAPMSVTPFTLREPGRNTPAPQFIALHRPLWARLAQALAAAWVNVRAAARKRREERLLAALPRHILRDVGLAHLVPESPRVPWPDLDRARW